MLLTQPPNVSALIALPDSWISCSLQRKPIKALMLDLDSSVSETDGRQEDSSYNG